MVTGFKTLNDAIATYRVAVGVGPRATARCAAAIARDALGDGNIVALGTAGQHAATQRVFGADIRVDAVGLLGAVAVAELTGIEHAVSAGGGAVVVFGNHTGTTAAVIVGDALGKLSVDARAGALCSSQHAALAESTFVAALWAVAITELAFFNRAIATDRTAVGVCQ